MAFMISNKVLSIPKPIFPFHKYDSNRSECLRGGSINKCGPLQMSSSAAAAAAQSKLEVGVQVFLSKGTKVLMGRRRTALGYGDFGLPGGHLEFGETFPECAAREVKEETGLEISGAELLAVTNTVASQPKPAHLIVIIMRAGLADADQTAINAEPDKCDGWDWYDWDDLPTPLFPPLEPAILEGLNPFPPK